MFQGRMMKAIIGGGIALFGVFLMIGVGGAIEAGSITAGAAFARMGISCVMILCGAWRCLE